MKGEMLIVFVSIFIVLGGTFLIFNSSPSFTGFVVYNESSDSLNPINNIDVVVTKEMVLSAINESYGIMNEMRTTGFF